MNAKDLLGMKIIDKNAYDLAKIAEIIFNTKTFKISKIYGSVGNPISKKYYEIKADQISTIGNYLQISLNKEDISDKLLSKIPEIETGYSKVNDFIGKTSVDSNGNVAGKVSDVDIDFKELKINTVSVSKSSSFGKSKDTSIISQEDISSIGDYLVINKLLKTEKEEKTEDKDEEDDTKVKVNIN